MTSLRVGSCSMGGNIANTDFLIPICKELGLEFVRISEWDTHDVRWKMDSWLQELQKFDIVVCAARVDVQPAKSANRVTQAMSLGLAVIASPLRAYGEVIRHGENGMIANTPEEWEACLRQLRDYPELRKDLGRRAKDSVQAFSMESVGKSWIQLIQRQAKENCAPPMVDLIIPTYRNLEHLKLCVESIRTCTDWPHNIIVVSSGGHAPTREWLEKQPDIIRVVTEERWHFSKANNEGLKVAKERYVCLLNDDTIVSVGWLNAMMHEAMKPGIGAVGPFSNCDFGWLHQENIQIAGRRLLPGMAIEDVKDILPAIQKHTHPKEVHDRKWIAFYCTLMPRAAVDQVGLLDEGFLSGGEDLDYCIQLQAKGYRIVQTFDSFVFHFGGKTRKIAVAEDAGKHQAEDFANNEYFKRKWGVHPSDKLFRNQIVVKEAAAIHLPGTPAAAADSRPLFVIYTGLAWERWTPKSLNDGGIGGSETATVYTAKDFHKKGFRSVVFGDCRGLEGNYDGVEYHDHTRFDDFIRNHEIDFFVSSRRADIFEKPIRAKKKACVAHDIWLSPDQNANLHQNQVDKFFVLSPWHRDFFLQHHKNVSPEKVAISRDGIDLARFKKVMTREKGRMIYSSSPDRGLDVLLDCLPEIRKEVPEAHVHVFYGFENWEKAVRIRKNNQEIAWMERIKRRLDDPGVVYRGRVGQEVLAREMLKAELFAYPTYFTETFAISAVENMAAGNPVVTSDLAALSSTVGDAGVLISGDSRSPGYQKTFISQCVRLLKNKEHWAYHSLRGLERAKRFSWDGIAEEWMGWVGMEIPKSTVDGLS